MKGMLTGPVTILNWSFVRDDAAACQPRCKQLALAIREEVLDLEEAGMRSHPDRRGRRCARACRCARASGTATWTGRCESFPPQRRTACRTARQIHTHMCYSEFNDIIAAIAVDGCRCDHHRDFALGHGAARRVRATSTTPTRSARACTTSTRPTSRRQAHIVQLMQKAAQRIPAERLWVNPDCGLKTRQWGRSHPPRCRPWWPPPKSCALQRE